MSRDRRHNTGTASRRLRPYGRHHHPRHRPGRTCPRPLHRQPHRRDIHTAQGTPMTTVTAPAPAMPACRLAFSPVTARTATELTLIGRSDALNLLQARVHAPVADGHSPD